MGLNKTRNLDPLLSCYTVFSRTRQSCGWRWVDYHNRLLGDCWSARDMTSVRYGANTGNSHACLSVHEHEVWTYCLIVIKFLTCVLSGECYMERIFLSRRLLLGLYTNILCHRRLSFNPPTPRLICRILKEPTTHYCDLTLCLPSLQRSETLEMFLL